MTHDVVAEARQLAEEAIPTAPDLTVVICSLNGEAGVRRCLRALAAQTIGPRLEIVVVDDGSTDGTSDVARGHGAVVIRHAVNRGLAAARNSGLHTAAAPIVAFLDDDCEPEPDWAQRLLAGYADSVIGVGGPIQPSRAKGFMAGYLTRNNPLGPLELNLATSGTLVSRFLLYLQRQWRPGRNDRRDVYSFAGANMSFRKQALLDLGGFDERFAFGGEDGDLCRRLALAFPQERLLFVPDAEVVHHFRFSLRDTLRRSRAYGRGSARLYRKWPDVRPTFFPWPVLILGLIAASIWFPVLLAAVVAVPQLLFPQALRADVINSRFSCLLDAYVRLLEEFSSDIGFLQGLWLFRHLIPEPAAPAGLAEGNRLAEGIGLDDRAGLAGAGGLDHRAGPGMADGPGLPGGAGPVTVPAGGRWPGRLPLIGRPGANREAGLFRTASLGALALLAAGVGVHGVWAVQLLLIPLLLVVPGVLLLRALFVPGKVIASFPVYVPCASLVMLLGTGLAVDLVGPLLGVAEPLRPWPLLTGLEIVCLALLAVAVRAPASAAIPWRSLPPARSALPLLLPVVAAAGALRLNHGHGNGVAVAALVGWVLVVVGAFVLASRLSQSALALVAYATGLAMLWSFSLRGDVFYGFDIADEYYLMHQTVVTGIWHASQAGNAFGAMLSVTVMPAELHALTGVPDALVFSVVYPMIAALAPVGVFFLARRILCPRWAFAAAAFIPTQAVFDQELPGIARQEIALVIFTALIALLLETKLARLVQLPLAALFALALAVSHYTTTYVAISLIGIGLVLHWVTSWFRPVPRVPIPLAVAFLAASAGALIWYGPVTHSASNVTQFVQTTEAEGLNLLPNQRQGGSLISNYLEGNTQSPISASQYAKLVQAEYAQQKPFVHPFPDGGLSRYALHDSSPATPPVRWNFAANLLSLGQVAAQQLIYLLAAVGALLLVLLRRKIPLIGRQLGLLTLGTLVFLVAIRLSGTLATFYNAERAFLQAMILLNIPVFWCLQELAARRRVPARGVIACSAALLALPFASGSGLVGAVLGGGTATNLANSGNDFEQFYVTPPELASASWLGQHFQPGELVYADRYGQLPLIAETGISNGLLLDITPQTLDRNAWVYASRTNVVDRRARADFGDHNVSYVFPAGFLDGHDDLVYTDGSSEVYHG